jgi:hypothetical protein
MFIVHHSGFIFKRVSETETTSFPSDESNVFYQEYLAWVAEGNTAEYIPSPEEQLGN